MKYKYIIFSIVATIVCFLGFAFASPNDPAEFGNLTQTTCLVGGSAGIVNCTGNGIFDGSITATNFYGIFHGNSSIWSRAGTFIFPTNIGDRVGIGINYPSSSLHIKSSTPGTIGSHSAGQIIIQNPLDNVWSNAVITGYESDGSGNPDQQLWYLGSASGSNSDIIFLNRRNSKLQLGTSGAAKMTILGDGNIGIGTTNPSTGIGLAPFLEIYGASPAVLLNDSDGDKFSIYSNAGNFYIHSDSDGANRLFIEDTSGNVGIGTTGPLAKLHIEKSVVGTFNALLLKNLQTSADDNVFLEMRPATIAGAGIEAQAPGGSDVDLAFKVVNNEAVSTLLFLDGDGNVGIGITNPGYPLHITKNGTDVLGGAGDIMAVTRFTNTADTKGMTIGYDDSEQVATFQSVGADTGFAFWTESGGWGERLRIHTDGNVGIGTTSPDHALDIVTGATTSGLRITDVETAETNKYGRIFTPSYTITEEDFDVISAFTTATENRLYIGGGIGGFNTATRITFNTGAIDTLGGTERMRIDSSGKVGIGTAGPGYKLEVNGSIFMTKDNDKMLFGAAADASIYYNGTHLFIDTQEVGSGNLIIPNGRVGIGTVSPFNKLEVTGSDDGNPIATFRNTDADNGYGVQIYAGDDDVVFILKLADKDGVTKMDVRADGLIYMVGDVGIGTASPGSYHANANNLVIYETGGEGGISIVTDNDEIGSIFFADGTVGTAPLEGQITYTHSTNKMTFVTNHVTALTIDSSQQVGIGTSNPSKILDIEGSNAAIDINAATGNPSLDLLEAGTSRFQLIYNIASNLAQINAVESGADIQFLVAADEKVRIKSSGNVGIGTDSPDYSLDVNGTIRGQSEALAGDVLHIGNDAKLVDINVADTTGLYGLQNTTIGSLKLGSGGGTISGSNGNIGIGTATPVYDLAIEKSTSGGNNDIMLANLNTAGGSGVRSMAYVTGDSSGDPRFVLGVSGITEWSMGIDNSDSNKFMVSQNSEVATTPRMTIDTSGNVGINTTTPQNALNIFGDLNISLPAAPTVGRIYLGGIESIIYDPGDLRFELSASLRVTGDITASGACCDYVFEEDYELMPLDELQEFIQENKYLPGYGGDTIDITRFLEKIEEIFLHLFNIDKRVDNLEEENQVLKEELCLKDNTYSWCK